MEISATETGPIGRNDGDVQILAHRYLNIGRKPVMREQSAGGMRDRREAAAAELRRVGLEPGLGRKEPGASTTHR